LLIFPKSTAHGASAPDALFIFLL